MPPKIHNLVKLAELSKTPDLMTGAQTSLPDTLNPLNPEARYPTYKLLAGDVLTEEQCATLIRQSREIVEWIKMQL